MQKGLLLIVDDARFMREVIKDALKDFFKVIVEADGISQAEDLVKSTRPNFVTLDITLDTEDPVQGLAALKMLKEYVPEAKIIVISALDQKWLFNKALSMGAAAYVVKPFGKEELGRMIVNMRESSNE
jgi:two-component system chemotaxis response regulator CheY